MISEVEVELRLDGRFSLQTNAADSFELKISYPCSNCQSNYPEDQFWEIENVKFIEIDGFRFYLDGTNLPQQGGDMGWLFACDFVPNHIRSINFQFA